MEQYRLQSQGLKDKYDLLSGERDAEYGRYRDSLAAWQTEAERLQREYADAREQDYGAYRDDVDDWKWQQEFEESRRRYDQQWEAEHPTDAPRVTTVYRTKKDGKEKKSTGFLGALLSAVTAASLRRK